MLAEFTRPDAPDEVVGRARWDGMHVRIEETDAEVTAALTRIFRPVPVVIDDPALRSVGTSGPVMLEPGDLRWFMAAASSRAPAAGSGGLGWDPAGAYRTFADSVERRNRLSAPED